MTNIDFRNVTDVNIFGKSVKSIIINNKLAWERGSGPYLEIHPNNIIFVYPDFEVSNDVFSNTHWDID